jgi:hypothetical protein
LFGLIYDGRACKSVLGTDFLLVQMIKRGVDVLFEQHGARKRMTDFGKGMSLGKKDHLIDIPKSKIKPDWMT